MRELSFTILLAMLCMASASDADPRTPMDRPAWWDGAHSAPVVERSCLLGPWRAVGPFVNVGGLGLDVPMGPEIDRIATSYAGLGGMVSWSDRPIWHDGSDVDLLVEFPPGEFSIAYAMRSISCDRAMRALLCVNSDDGCACWIDGKLVLRNPMHGGVERNLAEAVIDLPKGTSHLLLKVENNRVGWGFNFRLVEIGDADPKDLAKGLELNLAIADQPSNRYRLIALYRHLENYVWAMHHARLLLHADGNEDHRRRCLALIDSLLPLVRRDPGYLRHLMDPAPYDVIAGIYRDMLAMDFVDDPRHPLRTKVACSWLDLLAERGEWALLVAETRRLAHDLIASAQAQQVLLKAGDLLRAATQVDEALDAYYDSFAYDPGTAAASEALGRIIDAYLGRGDARRAAVMSEAVLSTAITDAEAIDALRRQASCMLADGGDARGAVAWLDLLNSHEGLTLWLEGPPPSIPDHRHEPALRSALEHATSEVGMERAQALLGTVSTGLDHPSRRSTRSLASQASQEPEARARLRGLIDRVQIELLPKAASEAASAGDIDAARELFVRVLIDHSDHANAAIALDGLLATFRVQPALEDDSGFEPAVRTWIKGGKFNARDVEHLDWHLARRLHRLGRLEEAGSAFARFQREHSTSDRVDEAKLMQGILHSHAGRYDDALVIYAHVGASSDIALRRRARLLIAWTHLFRHDYAKAREQLEGFLSTWPDGDDALKARSMLDQIPREEAGP